MSAKRTPLQSAFLPRAQCSRDRLRIHHDPDQDKEVTEREWVRGQMSCVTLMSVWVDVCTERDLRHYTIAVYSMGGTAQTNTKHMVSHNTWVQLYIFKEDDVKWHLTAFVVQLLNDLRIPHSIQWFNKVIALSRVTQKTMGSLLGLGLGLIRSLIRSS